MLKPYESRNIQKFQSRNNLLHMYTMACTHSLLHILLAEPQMLPYITHTILWSLPRRFTLRIAAQSKPVLQLDIQFVILFTTPYIMSRWYKFYENSLTVSIQWYIKQKQK